MSTWEQSKPEQLVVRLRTLISTAGLDPGARLGTKTELCDEYEVAPSTLNEALSILKAEGLVRVRTGPRGGVSVADSPPLVRLGRKLLQLDGWSNDVADCLVVRGALEPEIVRQATLHASASDIADLREVANRMREINDDDLAFLRLNNEMHERMAFILPDGLLRSIYVGVLGFVGERTVGVIPDAGLPSRAITRLQVHVDLVEAISTGDVGVAANAERLHHSYTESIIAEKGSIAAL